MKPGRIRCEVVGCKRTAPADVGDTEMICGQHWRAIPKEKRRAYMRARRRCDEIGETTPAYLRLWARMKAIANQRAMGI